MRIYKVSMMVDQFCEQVEHTEHARKPVADEL